TTAKPADDAVTTVKVADSSITQAKLAAGLTRRPSHAAGCGVTRTYPSPTVADDAITTVKIADGSVTTAKLADDAVTTVKVADSSDRQSAVSAKPVRPRSGAAGEKGKGWRPKTWGCADASRKGKLGRGSDKYGN